METYRIIYASTAARPFGLAELDRLLLQSRIYNYSMGISGLLLRAEMQFLQLLEGPPVAVAALYERIAHDPRHHHVETLEQAPVRRLLLPHTSMAFAEAEPVTLARLVAYLAPQHRWLLLPRAYNEQEIIADLMLEYVELHYPHLLAQPGDGPASRPQRSQRA